MNIVSIIIRKEQHSMYNDFGYILPTVRIQKIVLDNFKSVKHGEVAFTCEKKNIASDSDSDILGIYGQNGSGKTAVIEALAILKQAMSGDSVSSKYSECIAAGAEFAELSFTFDFQYPGDSPYSRTIEYTFKIDAVPNDKLHEVDEDDVFDIVSTYPTKVRIFEECINASGLFNGGLQKKQIILSSADGKYPIGPSRKIKYYVGADKESVLVDLEVNKRTAAKDAKSFIFMSETLNLFSDHANNSDYYKVLLELRLYATMYLYAVDTRDSGIAAVLTVPFNTRFGILGLGLMRESWIPQKAYEDLETFIGSINIVLPALVADLNLEIVHNEVKMGSKVYQQVKLYSRRKDVRLPLRDESAGIIKLISVLSLIIAAFNDESVTVAIDELDAGIYEYLLGEILTALETYGRGQFIFTSHNLRPLEVLKKESIVFTTSNPDNRYIRLKGVGRTNNLRSLYLREILGNTQDEQIYDAAKRQQMVAAFMKAGVGIGKEE